MMSALAAGAERVCPFSFYAAILHPPTAPA